ncbi:MAG: N-acetylglutaminylglutamine amidotransferase [Candidatus Magnetomorum sp.]|nr:N-acetylglutaminylglutamine amidotransferase [Candidatus Magnetomorum sp.]
MCGICGEFAFRNASPSIGSLEKIISKMTSRGPDASGLFSQSAVALGHRRLKIIDLSERSQQPMIDSDLGLSIVFNGAIYNYPELRKKLQQRGYRFFSQGDTEVILKAYHAWGKACVNHFNGMFAFAIYERDSGQLFLARDRLGIKPLYYTHQHDVFRFSSTLPALVAGGNIDTDIDPVALHHYMTFHSVVPAPYTLLKGVRKLNPGAYMTLSPNGEMKETIYWELNFTPREEEKQFNESDWKKALTVALEKAVIRRLVADVPVGVLLSGGLDSSLLVGLLAQHGQKNLNTFSIGFETVKDIKGNEFIYSDCIAETFQTQHHKISVDTSRVLSSLDHCIANMSEPMVSHDCIGFYLLSEEVSKSVKVVQSGQGADEVFAGYHWYPPMTTSTQAVEDYARVFFDRDHQAYTKTVTSRFIDKDYSRAFISNAFAKEGAHLPIDKALRNDISTMLVDDPVKRVDNMTMAWGLEARVPFLDHELVEMAARIPADLKVRDGGKYILKEVARNIIPERVIDRPKGYFPVPALTYLQGKYLDRVNDIIHSQAAKNRKIFNDDFIQTLLKKPEKHITPLGGSMLWQVVLLENWLQIHI